MQEHDKLAADEARRIAQYESVKNELHEKVHAEIAHKADRVTPVERGAAEALVDSLKRKAVSEVAATGAEIERGAAVARMSQVTDYLFYVLYGVIGLEIALDAVGARQSVGFKKFVDALSAPFLAPFKGLIPEPSVGRFRFMTSYIAALIVYMLLHLAVNGLYRMFVKRKTVV